MQHASALAGSSLLAEPDRKPELREAYLKPVCVPSEADDGIRV